MEQSNELLELFRTQQYAEEIGKALSNREIDLYISIGCKLLAEAQEVIDKELFDELGLTKEEVILDIERIEYNLDEFTEAFMEKEKAIVLMKDNEPMFFHMN